ncbi:MAG TPA: T9SS type A sorting domain-containing protein [Candidatus Marinimicrobia bacterium]|mgnify:CR=1 FL=1|nr:T9SS type A sorting domain-containing protein [Candidatus Neomarinimicrobiota bacterium]
MIKVRYLFLFLILGFSLNAESLKIVSYNMLKFSDDDTDRLDELAIILDHIQPDILLCQEIVDATAVNNILTQALNAGDYAAVPFHDGYDTDNAMLYRKEKVQFLQAFYLDDYGLLRNIAEYKIVAYGDTVFLYSAHLKASTGSDNVARRLTEMTIWREHLNNHKTGTRFVCVGDWNLYKAAEPAYQKAVADEEDNDGRMYDPLDPDGVWINNPAAGNWHDNYAHRHLHTQSPRTTQFGGGATGGLDDRFDFVLVSEALTDRVLEYTVVGNDGNHFNTNILNGENSSAPANVIQALHDFSDHLPVWIELYFEPVSVISAVIPEQFQIISAYPNPFNNTITIQTNLQPGEKAQIFLYDLSGKKIWSGTTFQQKNQYNFPDLSSGIYLIHYQQDRAKSARRITLLK